MKKLIISMLFVALSASFGFAQSGGLKGKVRDAKGNSLSGVRITARQNGEDLKSTQTDGKGEFVLKGLSEGKYNLVFEKDGFATAVRYDTNVKKNETINLGDRLILNVDQGTLIIINGSVFNQFGGVVYGAKIEIERISGGSVKKAGSAYTSQSGEFVFRFPEKADRFRVTATVKGVSATKEVEVSGAAVYRLALTLELPVQKN